MVKSFPRVMPLLAWTVPEVMVTAPVPRAELWEAVRVPPVTLVPPV
jgi:hypothetical protein